jgi:hypothetical protein
LRALGFCPRLPALLFPGQSHREGSHDPPGDLILQPEDVRNGTIVTLRPQMAAGHGIDQLGIDPHLIAGAPHAALQHVADAELLGDLLDLHGRSFVSEHRVPCDDEQTGILGQIGDQIVRHSIHEIFLCGIAVQIVERQHRERWLVRKCEGHPLD